MSRPSSCAPVSLLAACCNCECVMPRAQTHRHPYFVQRRVRKPPTESKTPPVARRRLILQPEWRSDDLAEAGNRSDDRAHRIFAGLFAADREHLLGHALDLAHREP